MSEQEIVFHCVRLFLGAICAFAVILLCAKKRSADIVCLAAFVLTFYAGAVYKILCGLGIVVESNFFLWGIDALSLAFEAVPLLFLLLSIVFMILRKR